MGTTVELMMGDCLEGMDALPDGSVDVVVTSPPYNIGVKYRRYKDTKKTEDYLAWMDDWATEVHRVLKVDGSLFLNLAGCPRKPMLPYMTMRVVSESFTLQNTIEWVKSITIVRKGEPISVGHFKPITSPRFLNDCHEPVYHFTKTGRTPIDRLAVGVPYADKSNATRWKAAGGRDLRCRGNVLFLPYKTVRRRKCHPAAFPPELAEYCIKLHGLVGEQTVLDPFMGEGNTALAAIRCGVKKVVGFEIDEVYHAMSIEKIGNP